MNPPTYPQDENKPVAFSHDATNFLLNGQPVQLFSGEMHYFRIPRPYWRNRLLKAKALGLNTICTYMPWNLHEPRPGLFDFQGDGGMLDAAAFVRLAHELGLWVILRPGPYICAEWDFGGLPAWLLADGNCRIRCTEQKYLDAVQRYLARVGTQLAPLTCNRSGPIIMVQVENEYGSFSNDTNYLRQVRRMLVNAGFGEGLELFTSDSPKPDTVGPGSLEECLVVANFGSRASEQLEALRKVRPNQPIMCGEYWCGWFDQWGKNRKGSADPATVIADLRWMVENNASFNLYMFHGGTNFGFTAGANQTETDYEPTVTGYDYFALLDEAGRPTAKYHAVREILAARSAEPLPEIPRSSLPRAIPSERFRWTGSASLWNGLPNPFYDGALHPMEYYGQSYGPILYRTRVVGLGKGKLKITDPHDYALVFLDEKKIATLDRQKHQRMVKLPEPAAGALGVLDILVWPMGRVNYGPMMLDRKGITERVELKHLTLSEWEIFSLPMNSAPMGGLMYGMHDVAGPAFHHANFELSESEVADTFLDLRGWKIGCVWVNDHNLGRFWRIGPQQTLYLPGCWLKPGQNEVVVFDLESDGRKSIQGLAEPVLDEILQHSSRSFL